MSDSKNSVSTIVDFAVRFIEQRAEQYLQDHERTKSYTGDTTFEYNVIVEEFHSMLIELADGIRKAQSEIQALCTVPTAGWAYTRTAGHDGPCAAIPATLSAHVEMPEKMPYDVESAIIPLLDCAGPETIYLAIRSALAARHDAVPDAKRGM